MFVKAYGFLSFAKIMVKNIGKIYVNNGLSGKYSQKRFDHAKQSATYAIETFYFDAIKKSYLKNSTSNWWLD